MSSYPDGGDRREVVKPGTMEMEIETEIETEMETEMEMEMGMQPHSSIVL